MHCRTWCCYSCAMLGSFLEGAKATIRRAGALDRPSEKSSDGKGASTGSSNINNEASRSVSHVEFKPSLVEQDLPKPAAASPAMGDPFPSPSSTTSESGSAYSVSRSFSLFRASSAASVTRVRVASSRCCCCYTCTAPVLGPFGFSRSYIPIWTEI